MSKLLLYCTKGKPYLYETVECLKDICDKYYTYSDNKYLEDKTLNGKIVAECDFEVEEITHNVFTSQNNEDMDYYYLKSEHNLVNESCLRGCEIDNYLKQNNGYAIHIKNLHIFDKPRELSEFDQVNNCCFEKVVDEDWEGLPIYACVFTNGCRYQSVGHTCDKHYFPIKHIKGMTKVEDNQDCKWKYIISLSPEEMCRIANKEQTILVRKKVLKEMEE